MCNVLKMRAALGSPDQDVALSALESLQQLSAAVGAALTPYYKIIVVQVNKRCFKAAFREAATTTLQTLEMNGGPDALKIIKSKIPTYMSVCY